MPDTKDNPTACLKFSGLLGHAFFVIEPSDHWTAVDGWRCAAECSSKESAMQTAAERPGRRVYQKTARGFREIKQ